MSAFVRLVGVGLTALAIAIPSGVARPQAQEDADAASTASSPKGPHGGEILSDGQNRFEVSLDPAQHQVSVYMLNPPAQLPQNMRLTLRQFPGTSQTLSLQAPQIGATLPRYTGPLSPGGSSGDLSYGNTDITGMVLSYDLENPKRTVTIQHPVG